MESRVPGGGLYSPTSSENPWEGRVKHSFIFELEVERVHSLFQMVFVIVIIRKHTFLNGFLMKEWADGKS